MGRMGNRWSACVRLSGFEEWDFRELGVRGYVWLQVVAVRTVIIEYLPNEAAAREVDDSSVFAVRSASERPAEENVEWKFIVNAKVFLGGLRCRNITRKISAETASAIKKIKP